MHSKGNHKAGHRSGIEELWRCKRSKKTRNQAVTSRYKNPNFRALYYAEAVTANQQEDSRKENVGETQLKNKSTRNGQVEDRGKQGTEAEVVCKSLNGSSLFTRTQLGSRRGS